MEFEQYLERDIITFLDSKMEKKDSTNIDREEEYGIYLLRDYLKELSYALDNDELTKAKKLFDELKKNYIGIPKGSLQRKKMYTLLEKMYEKIQNYVRIKEGKIEVIKQGDSEVLKDKTEVFAELPSASDKDKFDVSTVTMSESINRKIMPIGFVDDGSNPASKKDAEKNISTVESKIVDSSIKQSKSKDKYYEDKTEIPDDEDKEEINQNVFMRSKSSGHKSKSKTDMEGLKWNIDKKKDHDSVDNSKYVNDLISSNSEMDSMQGNDLDDSEENPIDKTIAKIEVLKMHLIERLLKDLSKKLDKSKDEQNEKIEELRLELIKKMSDELDKRFGSESSSVSKKTEQLREEILAQIYQEAPHIVTSKDNPIVSNNQLSSDKDNNINNDQGITVSIPSPNESERTDDKKNAQTVKYSGEDMRVVYEQAIYCMFENKYNEAAKLFRKIIDVQPKNKAANIRLQECIEKQQGSSHKYTRVEHAEQSINETSSASDNSRDFGKENFSDKNYSGAIDVQMDDSKSDSNTNDLIAKPVMGIDSMEKTHSHGAHGLRHRYNDKEIQNMYEEAMYTMFQSNYNEAAKIFQEILRIRPTNKAAKIRLQECNEARSNA